MASSLTNLLYHIVFSTKDRRALVTPELRAELYPYIGGIIRNEKGILLEIGGMPDHIHIVAKLPADRAVSEVIRDIKANSSRWANERRDLCDGFAWQTGYGAFTVSVSQIDVLRRYVRAQEKHHRKLSFKEEFIVLLKKHGIEYDERYIWG